MIIIPLSIVLHYCFTKKFDLTFIGFHNFWLQSCWMVVMTSVRAPSHVSSHIHYINSDLRHNFFICGYGIFPSLRSTISYPRTMSAYDLCISFPLSFVSTLWRHFCTIFLCLHVVSCPVSFCIHAGFDSLSSCLHVGLYFFLVCLTLTTFTTRSLFYGGPIWRVSTCFHPIITSRNFVNGNPCRALVKQITSICSVLKCAMDIFLFR